MKLSIPIYKGRPVSESTLKRKLFLTMLGLTSIILVTLTLSLFFFGMFTNPTDKLRDSLDLQMVTFRKDIVSHCDNLAIMGIHFSEDSSAVIGEYLAENNITFEDLKDSEEHIAGLQDALSEPVKQYLRQAQCSGAFLVLDTTVNSHVSGENFSRSGVYMQVNGYGPHDREILCYRGVTEVHKRHNAMPHRKWRLEFGEELFPKQDFDQMARETDLEKAYAFTPPIVLPGTSEKAALIKVPVFAPDGSLWGICGYELSASFFQYLHAQPTRLAHLACFVSKIQGGKLCEPLSCGADSGYYLETNQGLQPEKYDDTLTRFRAGDSSYIGTMEEVRLDGRDNRFILALLIPEFVHRHELVSYALQLAALGFLLAFFVIFSCIFFSRQYLTPVIRSLEEIREDKKDHEKSHLQEIDDLFVFLADKDKEHDDSLRQLENERRLAEEKLARVTAEYNRAAAEYEEAQARISSLSDFRRSEIDPEEYQHFVASIPTLTKKEREIYNLYLSGASGKEIQRLISINENTLKYHNRNIYSKLGVNSRKQLVLYATLESQHGKEKNNDSC